jgi:hypothetical protein
LSVSGNNVRATKNAAMSKDQCKKPGYPGFLQPLAG